MIKKVFVLFLLVGLLFVGVFGVVGAVVTYASDSFSDENYYGSTEFFDPVQFNSNWCLSIQLDVLDDHATFEINQYNHAVNEMYIEIYLGEDGIGVGLTYYIYDVVTVWDGFGINTPAVSGSEYDIYFDAGTDRFVLLKDDVKFYESKSFGDLGGFFEYIHWDLSDGMNTEGSLVFTNAHYTGFVSPTLPPNYEHAPTEFPTVYLLFLIIGAILAVVLGLFKLFEGETDKPVTLLLVMVALAMFIVIMLWLFGGLAVIGTVATVAVTPTPTPIPDENLADLPEDFSLEYGEGAQIIALDTEVTRNGYSSIRLDPHTSGDNNTGRECDGIWYNVTAGDRIYASCWMRTLTNSSTLDYPDCGARFGIDWYGYVDGVYQLLFADDFWTDYYDGNFTQMYVCDYNGGAWQKRTLDVIVPATAENMAHEVGIVTNVVMWLQGAPWVEDASSVPVWFVNSELYINPTGV